MKYMKLGSKPDSFHSGDDNVRFAKTEFATDLIVSVGDAKFYIHKFPLLSKSARLQKLVSMINDQNSGEIHLQDVPGGPSAFEICAKYCYGMEVTLNAYNVVAARCAAEYLEMYDTVEKGNLIYKIEVFLNSSIFRSWKDSIIVLQTTKSLIAWCEELKLISRAIDSIALMACIDTSKVDWSYTYNRKKLPSENGDEPLCNIRKPHSVPADWWVEDLCELPINLYKRVITTIKTHGVVSGNIIAEALHAYASRRLPGFSKAMVQSTDITKYRSLAETISWLLPKEKGSVPCYFLLKLLKAAILLDCGEMERNELMRRSAEELYQATVADLLIHAPAGETMMYDVDIVQSLVEQFVAHEQNANSSDLMHNELDESTSPICGSDYSRLLVTKLIEGYLAEVSKDPNLPLSKFVNLAEKVSNFPRSSHDGLYRAIDMYLKVHPGISKSERKRICRLMDCRKLSVEACTHAVQNERLPLRVVVQVLYFEQARQATSFTGNKMPEPHGSSRSITTIHDEDWNGMPTANDINELKGKFSRLQLGGRGGAGGEGRNSNGSSRNDDEVVAANKMKGMFVSKIFSKLWSTKEQNGEISSSDTSESPGSASIDGTKSTPSRSRKE